MPPEIERTGRSIDHSTAGGFSLLEIVVVLAITATLTLIALPQYHHPLQQGRRSDAVVALMQQAQRVERYRLENGSYLGAEIPPTAVQSPLGHYRLTQESGATWYRITATPVAGEPSDPQCGALSLDHHGNRSASGSEGGEVCW